MHLHAPKPARVARGHAAEAERSQRLWEGQIPLQLVGRDRDQQTRPPGRSTRYISASVAGRSGMCSITQLLTTVPKRSDGSGMAVALAQATPR